MAQDYIGAVFGSWTVIGSAPPSKAKKPKAKLLCRCACGVEKAVLKGNLVNGTSTSCGCLRIAALAERVKTHGASGTRTYRIWGAMKTRATNAKIDCAKHYSLRGIKCCQRWMDSFESFLSDMGEAPEGMSLDRIDCDGDYCPENCRWATWKEQQSNRRDTVLVQYQGQMVPVAEAERMAGLSTNTVRSRIRLGWPEANWFDPPLGSGNHFKRHLET
jgi:hypothetical protein